MIRRGGGLVAALALAGWGAVLLIDPEVAVQAVCGDGPRPPTWIVRVLGARRLAQELLVISLPRRETALAAAGTDTLHLASMLAACALVPEHRRAALTTAGIAAGSAAVTLAAARR